MSTKNFSPFGPAVVIINITLFTITYTSMLLKGTVNVISRGCLFVHLSCLIHYGTHKNFFGSRINVISNFFFSRVGSLLGDFLQKKMEEIVRIKHFSSVKDIFRIMITLREPLWIQHASILEIQNIFLLFIRSSRKRVIIENLGFQIYVKFTLTKDGLSV